MVPFSVSPARDGNDVNVIVPSIPAQASPLRSWSNSLKVLLSRSRFLTVQFESLVSGQVWIPQWMHRQSWKRCFGEKQNDKEQWLMLILCDISSILMLLMQICKPLKFPKGRLKIIKQLYLCGSIHSQNDRSFSMSHVHVYQFSGG